MDYKNLGRTGLKISAIALGSDDFGDGTSSQVAEKIIMRSVDAGINLIDTGNLYAGGESEKIIGRTLKQNKIRHKVIISTKVDHAPRKKGVSLDNYKKLLNYRRQQAIQEGIISDQQKKSSSQNYKSRIK